jgi:hypothetical protein
MSSSGVPYPPPHLPFVSIFNPQNFPPIPQAGTAGSNNFPNGINLTGTSGSARTITGISNLDFVSKTSTSSSGLLTQISQTDTEMIIGTPLPAGTQEINIYGSALLFNNTAVGTGNGNVSTTSDNTYVGLTNQDFYDASVRDNLTFPNSPSSIILNNTLGIQNTNAPSNSLRLRNASAIEWYLEPKPSTPPAPANLVNFNLNFGGMSIYLNATFINLTATSSVQVGNILTCPNNPTIDTTGLPIGRGTFYVNNKLPYFAYNDNGTTPIPTSQLLTSASLSNYATLTGSNTFTASNTFNGGIVMNGGAGSLLQFPSTFPSSFSNLRGLGLYNNGAGNFETDLICYGGAGATNTGLNLYITSSTQSFASIANFTFGTTTLGNASYNLNIDTNPTTTGELRLYSGGTSTTTFIIDSGTGNLNLTTNNGYINLFSDVLLNSYISQPSLSFSGAIRDTLPSSYGTFFQTSGVPYFTYNNGTTTPTASQLLTSASLSNYATLTGGGNSFTNTNTFTIPPTTSATQTYPQSTNTTDLATIKYVNDAIPSLSNYATLGGTNSFTGNNTFSQIPTITATTPFANDSSNKVATTAFVQSAIQNSAPPSVIIINTPNNTIINGNIVSWVFTIPSSTFLGNSFTYTGLSLLPSLNQVPTITANGFALTPSGTSIVISGNGLLQPFQVPPSLTIYNGYCFSVINSMGVQTIAFQSKISGGSGNINYTLQITFPNGSSALQPFIDNPCPFRFYIQPVNLFY